MAAHRPDAADHPSLVYVIGRVNQGIRREMRDRLAGLHLTVAEYTTLSVLRARPLLSNAQLARRALMTPQSMIEVLAKLESRGLVVREVDPDHGRILRAALTETGIDALNQADPAIDEMQEDLLAEVPARRRESTLADLLAVVEKLSGPRLNRRIAARG